MSLKITSHAFLARSSCNRTILTPLMDHSLMTSGFAPSASPTESWGRHQMEIFSALLAFCAGNSPVTGEFPSQRPVTRSFDVFFDLRLNERLSKQSWCCWFETPSRSLWRNCNVLQLLFFHMGRLKCHRHSSRARRQSEHHNDVIMSTMAPQITSPMIVYPIFYSRRRSKGTSKLRVTSLCDGNSPVTRKLFTFGDVIMNLLIFACAMISYIENRIGFNDRW